ncbi:MAG TPA: hypothetical protein PKD42_13940 [Chitinophagaceae bacterium]|jgi:hypothetical protein|nr:hypothetical protein [Chitinophagaceae bacterium]
MELPVKNIVSEIDLKPADALLPLFEAVVNAIISLQLTKELRKSEKKIQVQIVRGRPPLTLNFTGQNTITGFKVIDNGEGFTDSNLTSFKTAYSRKNKALGCKGIGRFTMLAGYKSVTINSVFIENQKSKRREISFDTEKEVEVNESSDVGDLVPKTIVELHETKEQIREYTALSAAEIAERIMEHCLVYYLCGELPRIEVLDVENEQVQIVNDLFSNLSREREKEFPLSKYKFKYYITRSVKNNNRKNHYIHYCANSRVVGNGKSIARVNSIFAYPIIENGVSYFLDIYVVSDYLNKKVFSARNGFDIPQDKENGLFVSNSDDLSFDEIETALARQLETAYNDFVKETQDRNKKELQDFIGKNPRYRRFGNRQDILSSVPPNLSEDKKEEYLHRIAYAERKAIDTRIQQFIEQKDISEDTIREIKDELIEKTLYDTDSLADYMLRRKAIIDIFNKFLEADKDGKYKLEEDIHNLIFPRGLSLDKIDYESHNLWLLDERFATYSFVDSDKPITSVSQKRSSLEPDLLMVNSLPEIFDNPISFSSDTSGDLSSMVIFEFKRPGETAHQKAKSNMRWEFSELIEKYFDDFMYADNKKNYKGRQVILQKDTPKFGYVIVDVIPPRLKEYNLTKGYKPTPFGTLYKINPEINLHLEVITFEQLLRAVEKRHAPFFDKLFNS